MKIMLIYDLLVCIGHLRIEFMGKLSFFGACQVMCTHHEPCRSLSLASDRCGSRFDGALGVARC